MAAKLSAERRAEIVARIMRRESITKIIAAMKCSNSTVTRIRCTIPNAPVVKCGRALVIPDVVRARIMRGDPIAHIAREENLSNITVAKYRDLLTPRNKLVAIGKKRRGETP